MRTLVVAALTVITTVGVTVPALAQSDNSARCGGAPSAETGSRDQTFCFTGEDVSGGVVGPNGQGTRVLRPMHGPSLLRIRAHFVPEMLKSVERL